jgi:hypothetical protein
MSQPCVAETGTSLHRSAGLPGSHAGPHLMVVHHCGKDEAKGARGHSSLRAATDTEIELKVIDAADKTATAYVRKQRDMAGDDVMAFKILPVTLAVTSCVIEPNEKTESGKKAMGLPVGKARDFTYVLRE